VPYDSVILVSFGGPEGPDDVLPFMENVTRGRGISRERLVEVSRHYDLFGGVSPINEQNRALRNALERALTLRGTPLPVYFGNRNWDPLLADTIEAMRADGRGRALAFVTSAYSSYSGCRQYREDIERACATVGDKAPIIDKLRAFYNHPGFIEPMADAARAAIATANEPISHIAFCAHSIPMSMADTSDYVVQLAEACRLVAERLDGDRPWSLVFQSRSGTPGQPWLEPDINDHLRTLAADGASGVAMVPIGFVSDHMEVVYDLDTQAVETARSLNLPVVRSATPGTDPRFVEMICALLDERTKGANSACLGSRGPNHDVCPLDCCPAPRRPPVR
jgi:protoporphyrin/coproporphyrin ferrochelatase